MPGLCLDGASFWAPIPFHSVGACRSKRLNPEGSNGEFMEIKTRRSFFGKIAAMAAVVISAPKLLAQQAPPSVGPPAPGTTAGAGDGPRRAAVGNHTHNGIYYFSG